MPKTISVVFSPIPQILGIVQTYHKSIVYDKGDGSVPLMIEGRPQISWGQGTPEQNANQGLSPGREIGGFRATPQGVVTLQRAAYYFEQGVALHQLRRREPSTPAAERRLASTRVSMFTS